MTAIADLTGIEVEHLLGAATQQGMVVVRCIADKYILLGHVDPAAAREIASHLMEAAARAEYEQDLWSAATAHGFDVDVIGVMLHLVREGEHRRLGDA